MKIKTVKILGILISVLVLFASCGQLAGSGESKVSVNLPYVSRSARALSDEVNSRLKSEHSSYRVHMNDRVLEGTGGSFSAYFAVGLKVDVFIESLNSKGEVIVRTVTKSIVVKNGENVVTLDMKADGNEVTRPTPAPQPVSGRVTYDYGDANKAGNPIGLPTDDKNYEVGDVFTVEDGSSMTWDHATGFKEWHANIRLEKEDGSTVDAGQPINANDSFKMPLGGVVLTAQWNKKQYRIMYNTTGNAPSAATVNPSSIDNVEEDALTQVTLATAPTVTNNPVTVGSEQKNYNFLHWKDTSDSNKTYSADTQITMTQNMTLEAVWNEVVIGTIYVSSSGDDNANDGSQSKPFATLQKAFDVALATSSFTTLVSIIPLTDLNGVSVKCENIGLANVMLDLNGKTITGAAPNAVLELNRSDTSTGRWRFILKDTGSGGKITGGNNSTASSNGYTYAGGIIVFGCEFEMQSGIITQNSSTGYGGGITAVDTLFTMSGGTISNNTNTGQGMGGGVCSFQGGSFTMTAGTITENTAEYGGGVASTTSGGSITISGGSITKNTAKYKGGGVYCDSTFTMSGSALISENKVTFNITSADDTGTGGGVYIQTLKTFNMNGGTISKNTVTYAGAGVYLASQSSFTMTAGTITENDANTEITYRGDGGGVYAIGCSITMSGGEISKNTAKLTGGGMCVREKSSFTMSDGEITGNNVTNGATGGVYVYNSTFTMSGKAKITKNTATSTNNTDSGGGVYVYGDTTFTMNGGEISENVTGYKGGGVSITTAKKDGTQTTTFTFNGGDIKGNKAGYGGGVYVDDASAISVFNGTGGTLSGNKKVSGSTETDSDYLGTYTGSVNTVDAGWVKE